MTATQALSVPEKIRRRRAVAGGTAGIGLACAQLFGQLGAKVAICGTNPAKLAAALEELKAQGITAFGEYKDIRLQNYKSAPSRAGIRQTFGRFACHTARWIFVRRWQV